MSEKQLKVVSKSSRDYIVHKIGIEFQQHGLEADRNAIAKLVDSVLKDNSIEVETETRDVVNPHPEAGKKKAEATP